MISLNKQDCILFNKLYYFTTMVQVSKQVAWSPEFFANRRGVATKMKGTCTGTQYFKCFNTKEKLQKKYGLCDTCIARYRRLLNAKYKGILPHDDKLKGKQYIALKYCWHYTTSAKNDCTSSPACSIFPSMGLNWRTCSPDWSSNLLWIGDPQIED